MIVRPERFVMVAERTNCGLTSTLGTL